ncbi:MAG: protoporphyrinogen oxidase [Planctomycetia bacterium]|nr:protoporphyrinogen oxidase [Planctomycetia bacterium]
MPAASNLSPKTAPRIAVGGGGITGLAAAHRLLELAPGLEVWLIEAGPRLGGVLQTENVGGFLVERSADNFIRTPPSAEALCRRIGLQDELIETNPDCRRAFIVRKGRLHPVPEGFLLMAPTRLWPLMRTGLLSPLGKLRLLCEYLVPRRKRTEEESLASFARRRLGREAFERLVQPLVSGIYTADAEKLSVQAALPRFAEMERTHRSLIRAAMHEREAAAAKKTAAKAGKEGSGARYGMFLSLRKGMSQLVEALAGRIAERQKASGVGSVLLGAAVSRIEKANGRWRISITGRDEPLDVDAVVLTPSAPQAGGLIESFDAALASELSGIPYAGSVIVAVGYRRDQIRHPLDGFGFVVPAIERRPILAASFSSVKFEGRAPSQHVLLRVFLGGAERPDLVEADDDLLRKTVAAELQSLLGVTGPWIICQIYRWKGAMPQYHVGHLERLARIEARLKEHRGLHLAGNAYRGVGIPSCVQSGEQAAEAALKELRVATAQLA